MVQIRSTYVCGLALDGWFEHQTRGEKNLSICIGREAVLGQMRGLFVLQFVAVEFEKQNSQVARLPLPSESAN